MPYTDKEKQLECQRKHYWNNHGKLQKEWLSDEFKEKRREREQKNHHERNRRREERIKNRELVIAHYSNGTNKCACCGENNIKFLSIDHIEGGGTEHRKQIGGSGYFYLWLIKNNFPSGYQVLCMNCNWGKRMNDGVCPHQEEIKVSDDDKLVMIVGGV